MKKTNKGFTLIELMIVVAILAILAAVALPGISVSIKKSRDGKALGIMGAIRSQASMVYADLLGDDVATGGNNIWNGGIIVGGGADPQTVQSTGVDEKSRVAINSASSGASNGGAISCGTAGAKTKQEADFAYVGTGLVNFTATAGNDTKGVSWFKY